MRIIIDTKPQHRALFMEMAKAVKAKVYIEEANDERPPPKKSF